MKPRHLGCRPATLIVLSLACLCWSATVTSGQDLTNKRGFQPAGSYAIGDFETINMVNGNMILNFPLGKLPPGRGGMSASINLLYNSKLWDTHVEYVPDLSNQITPQNFLGESEDGGWRYGLSYQIRLINRNQDIDDPPQCPDPHAFYIWKLQVIFPDGSTHDFRPAGFADYNDEGYFTVMPDGWESTCGGPVHSVTGPMTYFSLDGTYLRLVFTPGAGWTLSMPDGGRVVTDAVQRIYDRNNNYLEIFYDENYNNSGEPATIIADQLGRNVALHYDANTEEDLISFSGFNNEVLTWRVKWKTIEVNKSYTTTCAGCGQTRGGTSIQQLEISLRVVDRITLPEQSGGLTYIFGYNADTSNPSLGWGEVNSITLPSSAQATYGYSLDGSGPLQSDPRIDWVLKNHPKSKTLTYQQEYDGSSAPATEVWQYDISTGGSSMTAPDGGVTSQSFGDISYPTVESGLVRTLTQPDGTLIERIWNQNLPFGISGVVQRNPFIKTEFTSIKDAAGNLSQTAIKDYSYDKNGNVTQVKEYDWVSYASTRGPNGPIIPAGAPLKRVSTNTYSRPTPDSSDSSSNTPDCYWIYNSPNLRNAVASSEVSDGAAALARSEFSYDDPTTTGNLTQKTTWDSTKGAYSNPLTTGNSISVSMQYNQYGSPILTTDARGYQTEFTYGNVGGFTDLYPTQIKTAYQTLVQRTESRAYDFGAGLVTSVTDVDNNVTSSTTYDAFGRPTLVKAAEGKPEETRTATEYSDVNRRVIVRADLNTLGDGKLVSIQHYDQLGRVRLTRQLEDSATQSATDETQGIKVQTRYLFSGFNSYVLTSHPYRAAYSSSAGSESTMGWTRSKSDNGGRMIEVQTFGGSVLPAPWGSNANSTGAVTTAYDAEFTTVTDQAGKMRRSVTNALGQLVRVDEPNDPSVNNSLGTSDNPAQPTNYSYDALGNLVTVNQGSQTRIFGYSSLARLLSANNPESGMISYQYDANGNLTQKTDARSITANYVYDALNRVTLRSYSDGTPTVTYSYDTVAQNGKGRLASVSSSVSSYSYSGYDATGKVLGGTQTIGSQSYSITNVTYDLAGHLKTMTYPSGRTVTNTFDNAGRLQSLAGTLGDGTSRTYSTGLTYASAGQMTQEQFGTTTPIYNKLFYNSRGQLSEILTSTSGNDATFNRGKIVNDYSLQCGGASCNATDNNGNLRKQTVYVPNNDLNTSPTSWYQQYEYDPLNRLQRVHEYTGNTQLDWQQEYVYDRWGNRTIHQTNTFGTGIPKPDFTVSTSNNRLGVPNGQTGTMTYDLAGNLTTDTYSAGAVTRVYDAENRMTQETQANSYLAGSYSYDGDGRRVKRIVNGTETWQVYGLAGELLAEYAANVAYANPQKEYGYRNGQLLITATVTAGWGTAPTLHDNPLVASETTVQARHITELRDAINALRSHLNMSAYSWQYSVTTNDWITANPILEIRTALDQALGAPSGGYAAGLAQYEPVKAIHIQELRDRVLAAWTTGSSTQIHWLVTDQLGTPRMIFDQSGSLASVSRHDYLPFGEELFVGTGGRTTAQGYSASDNVRQKFTSKERDIETGLDYFLARYYSSAQGRFTSPDEFVGGPDELFEFEASASANPTFYAELADPQSLNKYQYAYNSPMRFVDSDGHQVRQTVSNILYTAGDFVDGGIRGVVATVTFGHAGAPRTDDTRANRLGQGTSTAALQILGADLATGGAGLILGTEGGAAASPVVDAATIGGIVLTAGAAKNAQALMSTPMLRNSKNDQGSGDKQGESGQAEQGRTGGRNQPKDRSVEGTHEQLKGVERKQKQTSEAGGYRISTAKSKQNVKTALKKIRSSKDDIEH